MKTNNEQKAREIAQKTHTVWRDEEGEDISSQDDCYEAAMQMAEAKDRQFAEIIKSKADKMYAKSQGGGSYDDHADALTIYDYLSDFYTEITGEYL